ncbi:MAG: hypothetical protein ISR58_01465 [Anaerolineales bacterium]|nr:hypothetical protein [Chloroflexota bacterium]MBL6979834.1 hypothetical protein [Anaerolineales bacterium]
MNNDWNLRDVVFTLTHRWYIIALCFLVGAVLGWGVSRLMPPLYRAELDLYVGINAYRGPRDRYIVQIVQDELRKLDDYKNWQMEQINGLSLTDEFLSDTLTRLQSTDKSWNDVTVEDIFYQLRGSWRNAGRWHLAADAAQPELAIQAVDTWAEVIDERMNIGINSAREMVALDASLVATADELTYQLVRYQTLMQIKAELEEAKRELEDASLDDPMGSYDHWRLLSQTTQAADWNLGWSELLEDYPIPDESPAEYLAWVERATVMVESDLEILPERIEFLEEQHDTLSSQYAEAAEKSLGLSAAMDLEKSKEVSAQVEDVRPSGTLMLVGGILAVAAWLLIGLVRISQRREA